MRRSWMARTVSPAFVFAVGVATVVLGGCSPSSPSPSNQGDSAADTGASGSDAGGEAGTIPACTVQPPTNCPKPPPTYADVEPIFNQRCVSTCHMGRAGGPWPLDDYQSIADWQSDVRGDLMDCSMPPADAGVPMTDEERMAILTWIRCGLPK